MPLPHESTPVSRMLQLPAQQNWYSAPLRLWRHHVVGTKIAVAPPNTDRPNPLVVGNLVVASIFSPGQIVALDRATGTLRWNLELPYFGVTSLYFAEGLLFGGTTGAVWAIEPATGKVLWKYEPYPAAQESIYALPVVSSGRLYIGDRRAQLHCVSVADGSRLWTVRVSDTSRDCLNATAYPIGDRIIVATARGNVSALEAESGRVLWSRKLKDDSHGELKPFRGMVLVPQLEAFAVFDPVTGEPTGYGRWEDEELEDWAVIGDRLFTVRTRDYRIRSRPPGEPHRHTGSFLSRWEVGEEARLFSYPRGASPDLRWNPHDGYLYEASYGYLGIVDPETGQRLAGIERFEPTRFGPPEGEIGIPDVHEATLYVLSSKGWISAVRHPLRWPNLRRRTHRTVRTRASLHWLDPDAQDELDRKE